MLPKIQSSSEGFGALGGGGALRNTFFVRYNYFQAMLVFVDLRAIQHLLRLVHRVEVVEIVGDRPYGFAGLPVLSVQTLFYFIWWLYTARLRDGDSLFFRFHGV